MSPVESSELPQCGAHEIERYLSSGRATLARAFHGGCRKCARAFLRLKPQSVLRAHREMPEDMPPEQRAWLLSALQSHGELPCSNASAAVSARGFLRLVDGGGFETARALVPAMEETLARLRPPLARALVLRLLDVQLAWGNESRARTVARVYEACLRGTRHDASQFADALGARPAHQLRLSSGHVNPYRLSVLLHEGRLPANQTYDVLHSVRAEIVADSELELLVASAHAMSGEACIAGPLNRFLKSRAVPSLEAVVGNEPLPSRLSSGENQRPHSGPVVSAIVSARNAEATVAFAIDSLLAQTYENIEVLVCDDGSTDRTVDCLTRRYGDNARVRLFVSERNQGPYNIRNQLARVAKGAYVTFHDADDYAVPTRIQQEVDVLRNGSLAGVATQWFRVREDSTFVFYRDLRAARLCSPSLLVPREMIDQLGGFRSARFGADGEFLARLRARHPTRVSVIRKPPVLGLWTSASLTRRQGAESLETGYRSVARLQYLEQTFRQLLLGSKIVSDESIDRVLQLSGNYVEPCLIHELTLRDGGHMASAASTPCPIERGTAGESGQPETRRECA